MLTKWRKPPRVTEEVTRQDPPLTIQVLGDGGAFDTHKTNSSFLIDVNGERMLFDCGYNVFAKLKELKKTDRELIKNIDTIWISHAHDEPYRVFAIVGILSLFQTRGTNNHLWKRSRTNIFGRDQL